MVVASSNADSIDDWCADYELILVFTATRAQDSQPLTDKANFSICTPADIYITVINYINIYICMYIYKYKYIYIYLL